MYIAIVKTEANRVSKFQEYANALDAQAHVGRVIGSYPAAFVYNNTGNIPLRDLWVQGTVVTVAPVVDPVPTPEEIYDALLQQQRLLKAYILCINDGSIVPGSGMSPAQLKNAIKAKL